jgi:hypothetical protein
MFCRLFDVSFNLGAIGVSQILGKIENASEKGECFFREFFLKG